MDGPTSHRVTAEVTAPNLTEHMIKRLVESLDYVHCRLVDIDGRRAHIECTIVAISEEGAVSYLHRRADQNPAPPRRA